MDGWLEGINDGLINGIYFIDFTKCFYTIDPGILLFKLEKYGIRGQTYKWFTSYLTDRSQSTIVNGIISELHDVRIGIPQGSVLGPILFLLFVNDLPMFVSNVTTFADDTMIEIRAKNVNEAIIGWRYAQLG